MFKEDSLSSPVASRYDIPLRTRYNGVRYRSYAGARANSLPCTSVGGAYPSHTFIRGRSERRAVSNVLLNRVVLGCTGNIHSNVTRILPSRLPSFVMKICFKRIGRRALYRFTLFASFERRVHRYARDNEHRVFRQTKKNRSNSVIRTRPMNFDSQTSKTKKKTTRKLYY